MARIFVAFYNGLLKQNAIPIFFESFCNGLKENGNELFIEMHNLFAKDMVDIPQNKKEEIISFNPDICFVFNNAYFDLDFLDCKTVIIEVDSPLYYSNKSSIINYPEKYSIITSQTSNVELIKKLYGEKVKVGRIPFFTEVSNKAVNKEINISFIGTRFDITDEKKRYRYIVRNYDNKEMQLYLNIIKDVEINPFITKEELKKKFGNVSIIDEMDLAAIVATISGEQRIKALSSISDLGLKIYGTKNWIDTYYYDFDLQRCYDFKGVYSLADNEQIYNKSKIAVNISHLQAKTGYPWRIMDIMASDAVLISDWHDDFVTDFGKDIFPIYDSRYDLRSKCKRLLEDKSMREEIVGKCNEIINCKYRFKHYLQRLEEALDIRLVNKE